MPSVQEKWLPVVGYEGRYEVSSAGAVRSARTVLRPQARHGYSTVCLYKRGEGQRHHYVHRLVAIAFHGPGQGDVRHLNHVRDDNRAANLAWGTRAENAQDSVQDQRQARGEALPHAKLTEPEVRAILADPRNRRVIAAEYGVHFGTVTHIKRRLSWAHVEPGPGGVVPPRAYRKRRHP